jgi:hydrogenase maturation protease
MPSPNIGHRALVIGIGNSDRGDDSVGRIVVRRIKRRNLPFLRAIEHEGEGTSLMELWKGADHVIVVDAVSTGRATGTIHRFDALLQSLPGQIFNVSTHAFGLVEAVELARALKQLPARLVVFGIEGRQFKVGAKPSAGVQDAVPFVVGRVLEEARPGVKREP